MMTFPIYGKIKTVPNHQPETTHDWEWLTSQLSMVMTGGWFIIPLYYVIPCYTHINYSGECPNDKMIQCGKWMFISPSQCKLKPIPVV